MPWSLPVPTFTGDAGIGELVAGIKDPAYVKLLGKCVGGGLVTAQIVRRLPSQVAMPIVLVTGIYIGLEMAAWLEEEATKRKGPVIDVTAEPAVPIERAQELGYDVSEVSD
jgi:hypothetical protein